MNGKTTAIVLGVLAAVWASGVEAADYEEYMRLTEAATEALDAVREAGPECPEELRRAAVDADLAVIWWLETFFDSEEFHLLSPDQQAAAYSDRMRWEYNLARQLTPLGRCEQARDRIDRLREQVILDEALRPHLEEAQAEAVECIARSQLAELVVSCTPADAVVVLDGEPLGPASRSYEIEVGDHTVRLEAPGYAVEELTVSAPEGGEVVTLGPIALVALVEEPPSEPSSAMPGWHIWTLWGVGAAGLTTSAACFGVARHRTDLIDDLPSGLELVDPGGEQDLIDTLEVVAYTSAGIGVAAAVTGTILYLKGREREAPDASALSWGAGAGRETGRVWVGVSF